MTTKPIKPLQPSDAICAACIATGISVPQFSLKYSQDPKVRVSICVFIQIMREASFTWEQVADWGGWSAYSSPLERWSYHKLRLEESQKYAKKYTAAYARASRQCEETRAK